jgi:hypothetical protein
MIKEGDIYDNDLEKVSNQGKFPYRQAVGALMFLMTGTRPDLAYSVSRISRVSTDDQLADICTKALDRIKLNKMCSKMGLE